MLTIEQVQGLRHGDILIQTHYLVTRKTLRGMMMYHEAIQPRTILPCEKLIRWRVSGKPKLWKTRPDEVRVPIKHGLYQSAYVGNWSEENNLDLFELA